jgi:DNA-binding NarL/FixJ family response regulator
MDRYGIVLSDDHVLLRQGVKRIIEGVAGFEVLGEASDGLDLLALLKRLAPQLVVLDISMPRLRGLEAIPEIKAMHPGLKVLVLTMHKEQVYLIKALSAGANGYVLKEDAEEQLFSAIDKIRRGKFYLSPKLSDDLTETLAQTCRGDHVALEGEQLSLRERQVLKLTAEGRSSREVAELLCISHRTVEHHRANVLAKLKLKGTAELVRYAVANGYI